MCTEQSLEADEKWNTHFRVYTVRLRVEKIPFVYLAKGEEKSGIVRKLCVRNIGIKTLL